MSDLPDLSHLADDTVCSEPDCTGRIETSIIQNIPLVACPKMENNELYLQGQVVADEDALNGLQCPLVKKLQERAGQNVTSE